MNNHCNVVWTWLKIIAKSFIFFYFYAEFIRVWHHINLCLADGVICKCHLIKKFKQLYGNLLLICSDCETRDAMMTKKIIKSSECVFYMRFNYRTRINLHINERPMKIDARNFKNTINYKICCWCFFFLSHKIMHCALCRHKFCFNASFQWKWENRRSVKIFLCKIHYY